MCSSKNSTISSSDIVERSTMTSSDDENDLRTRKKRPVLGTSMSPIDSGRNSCSSEMESPTHIVLIKNDMKLNRANPCDSNIVSIQFSEHEDRTKSGCGDNDDFVNVQPTLKEGRPGLGTLMSPIDRGRNPVVGESNILSETPLTHNVNNNVVSEFVKPPRKTNTGGVEFVQRGVTYHNQDGNHTVALLKSHLDNCEVIVPYGEDNYKRKTLNRSTIDEKMNIVVENEVNKKQKKRKQKEGNKRKRLSTKIESNNNQKTSTYNINKQKRINIMDKIKDNLIMKIHSDIFSRVHRNERGISEKYDPVPLLVISDKMVQCYLSFHNCIILKNPVHENGPNSEIYYKDEPYIGKNIPKKFLNQYENGLTVSRMKKKRISILTPAKPFLIKVKSSRFNFIDIKLPDWGCSNLNESNKKFSGDYILLMLASNESDNRVDGSSVWTKSFSELIQKKMTVNMAGDDKRESKKHFGCRGKYYGYGLISKYEVRNQLSVFEFKGNETDDAKTQNLINILKNDIEYVISRMLRILPFSIYCGFSLMSAMAEIIHRFPDECSELIRMLEMNGVDRNNMATSNWACINAATEIFHQECDSSYTLLAVPFCKNGENGKDNKEDNLSLGGANFLFSWCSKEGEKKKFLPLTMDEGVSIFFSGYGCYHRQHRTDNITFWNIASYQNRQFYQKLRMSVIRCLIGEER